MQQIKQLNAHEVAMKPHVYDESTKQYTPRENIAQEYPKWMYKENRSRVVANADDARKLSAKGWANTPPKPVAEPDDLDHDLLDLVPVKVKKRVVQPVIEEVPAEDDLVPVSSSPSRKAKARKVA